MKLPLFESHERFLVTGGAGLIGSAVVWELNQRGCENIVITDLLGTSEKWRNLVPLRYADYLEADDFLAQLKAGAFDDVTAVFHLGACSATTERDAGYLIRNNFEYTKTLAKWALEKGIRFVYASSAATYGDGNEGMSDTERDLHRFRPLNMYGYSKHLFDLYAQKMGWLEKLTGLKYFNVFGPNEDHKGDMRSVVHKSYAQVRDEGVIRLFRSYRPEYGDGEQKRDFLYVKDAVKMTLFLAERDAGGLFNIGSGRAQTWNELAAAIFRAMGKPLNVQYVDMPESLQPKYQYYTKADTARLTSLGYPVDSMFPLEKAVDDYINGYLVDDRRLGDEP